MKYAKNDLESINKAMLNVRNEHIIPVSPSDISNFVSNLSSGKASGPAHVIS